MHTHKHHVFCLETTTEMSHSDATRFSCKFISDRLEFLCLHISSNILHFWQSLSFYLITGSWHKKIYCDFLAHSAALRPWKLVSLALPLFLVKLVSELNLWQAQNKPSNICSCSSLKCSKGISKNAIFTWWRRRKD